MSGELDNAYVFIEGGEGGGEVKDEGTPEIEELTLLKIGGNSRKNERETQVSEALSKWSPREAWYFLSGNSLVDRCEQLKESKSMGGYWNRWYNPDGILSPIHWVVCRMDSNFTLPRTTTSCSIEDLTYEYDACNRKHLAFNSNTLLGDEDDTKSIERRRKDRGLNI